MSDRSKRRPKPTASTGSVMVALTDINGVLRGKRLPAGQVKKIAKGGMRMPLSGAVLDIWGRDIEESELVFETGDRDGMCQATNRGAVPCPWMDEPMSLLPVWLFTEDGAPFLTDPRQALAAILTRYQALDLRPVVATEMEFYLTDPAGPVPQPPVSPRTGQRVSAVNILSVNELDAFAGFIDEVYATCAAQDIAVDAAIAEGGAGQFEINLLHGDDALRIADDAVLFKHLVRGIARKHGFAATFMAKPYGNRAGSGMHVHFSVLDDAGANVFDDGGEAGTDVMRRAVGGLLATMQENALIFAPHLNSFRRLQPESHAPTGVGWAYENRTAAIRIPGGPSQARRIEHRVAGADANPYLVLAAILGGALLGIEGKMDPGAPLSGDAYQAEIPHLPDSWTAAMDAFEAGAHVAQIFDPMLRRLFLKTKRQELRRFMDTVTALEYETLLEVV